MLSKVGSFKFHIESYVCDFTEKATITVMSRFLLDAASIHAQEREFGYNILINCRFNIPLSIFLKIPVFSFPEDYFGKTRIFYL